MSLLSFFLFFFAALLAYQEVPGSHNSVVLGGRWSQVRPDGCTSTRGATNLRVGVGGVSPLILGYLWPGGRERGGWPRRTSPPPIISAVGGIFDLDYE